MKTKLFRVPLATEGKSLTCPKDCGTCDHWVAEECVIDRVMVEAPQLQEPIQVGRNMGWSEGEDMSSNIILSPSHPDGGLPELGGLDRLISQSNVHFAQFNAEGGDGNGASRVRKLITQLPPDFVPGWKQRPRLKTLVLTEAETVEELERYNLMLEEEALIEQAKEDAMDHVAETLNESFHDPMNEDEELLEMEEPKEEEEQRFYSGDSPWVVVFEVVPRTMLEVWNRYPEWTVFNEAGRPIPEEEMTSEQLKLHQRTQQKKLFEVLLPAGMNPVAGLNNLIDGYASNVKYQSRAKIRQLKNIMSKSDDKVFKKKMQELVWDIKTWESQTIKSFFSRVSMMRQALKDVFKDAKFGTGQLRTIWVERSGQIPKYGTHQRLGNRRMHVGSYYSKFHGLVRYGSYHKGKNLVPIQFNEMKNWVTWAVKNEKVSLYEAKCLWNLWKGELKMARAFNQKEADNLAHHLECLKQEREGEDAQDAAQKEAFKAEEEARAAMMAKKHADIKKTLAMMEKRDAEIRAKEAGALEAWFVETGNNDRYEAWLKEVVRATSIEYGAWKWCGTHDEDMKAITWEVLKNFLKRAEARGILNVHACENWGHEYGRCDIDKYEDPDLVQILEGCVTVFFM